MTMKHEMEAESSIIEAQLQKHSFEVAKITCLEIQNTFSAWRERFPLLYQLQDTI